MIIIVTIIINRINNDKNENDSDMIQKYKQ
jgi:hypothetical protein